MFKLRPTSALPLLALLWLAPSLTAQTADTVAPAVEQLRHAAGEWDVTTELFAVDGSVARSVEGSYRFEWVVPDRVLIGRSEQPELGQASAILFYYQPSVETIGMASVGADGQLWVMTGPADGEVRTTPPTQMPDGSTLELRFTRYNVEPDRFESKMEYSRDGGESWAQGNHQLFRRAGQQAAAAEGEMPPLSWDNLTQWLDAQARDGFEGAVLVVHDGEVVLDRGYGLANRERGFPITPDTIFATGSLPIDYTHVAILWLAQEGKLELSDPITKYFDNVPADKRAITLEHLMTGGSGLPDFHDIPSDRDPDHSWIDRDEAMRRIFGQELLFAPGEGDEHSHSAWGVLAAVVEIVSGQSFQDFTREHIYGPAGMADTGFNGDPVPAERLAIGYGLRSDGEINAPPYWGKTSWLVLGSGGQIGTTRDTARFIDALREGKILQPEWAERYFGPGISASRNGDVYGYEMFVYTAPGAESYAITLTNANKPASDSDADDETHFVRVSRAVGGLIIDPYRPKFSLGIAMDPGPEGIIEVVRVGAGSAAERDGLRVGDLLVSAGGEPFGDDALAVLTPYLVSGDPIVFVVRRDGEEIEITVRPNPR
jgi:CubicO group peptidase (beta-lactamase class C family)